MSNTNPNYGHSRILSNLIHAMNHSSSFTMTSSSGNNGDGTDNHKTSVVVPEQNVPLLQGYLYKIHKKSGKTQKYFVIFDDAPNKPGRLEYFDTEKKFRSAMIKNKNSGNMTSEKRSIVLCTCFNINRRFDTKFKNVIGLYRKDDTFSIMTKDEAECNKWLKQLLILQRGKESVDTEQPRPNFEHVWEVEILKRGLGVSYRIFHTYRVCITGSVLSLVRIGPPTIDGVNRPENVEFALAHMRACGSTQTVFYIEFGRSTSTGAGEIWMETHDTLIAENMNTVIYSTASKKSNSQGRSEENITPMIRIRSQSATEASKPITHRRATLAGKTNFSPSEMHPDSAESSATSTGTIVLNQNALKPKNNQTQPHSVSQMSLQTTGVLHPSSQSQLTATHKSQINHSPKIQCLSSPICNNEQQPPLQQHQQLLVNVQQLQLPTSTASISSNSSSCSNSISSISISTTSNVLTAVVSSSSPSSMICHQRALSLPQNSNVNVSNYQQQHQQHLLQHQTSTSSSKTNKIFAIQPVHHRTRSLPLTEETAIDFSASSPPNFAHLLHQIPPSNNSMESIVEDYHNIDSTNNNNNNNNVNSASGSSRSSFSILKHLSKIHANQVGNTNNAATSPSQLRKKRQHIITASLRSSRDRCDSFPMTMTRNRTTSDSTPTHSQVPPHNSNYVNSNNNSMPPPRRPVSMSCQSHRYGNSPPNNSSPISPPSCSESDASSASIDETDGFIQSMTPEDHGNHMRDYLKKKGSPVITHDGYMDMHPYSSSPSDPSQHAYIPMSPGDHYRGGLYGNSGTHSRASSLAEDNDGYVPMHASSTSNHHENYLQMSQNSEDYMNMQPAGNSHMSIHGGDLSSATSSCSITSGTPSTDIRFSEYHLDKVQARFTPSEDDELLDRPPRTYSVGSKLEHAKRKLHIDRIAAEHSSLRHRAYSVGSRNIKVSRAELASHSGSHTPSSQNSPVAMNHLNNQEINNNNSNNNNNNNNSTNSKNKKSSSAPILANVHGGNSKINQGSLDPMDDLMEIDFSSRSSDSSTTRINSSSTPIKSSPMTIPTPARTNENTEDYINMSSGGSNRKSGSYVDMRPGSNRRINEKNDNDYMDMNPPALRMNSTTKTTSSCSLSSSPLKGSTRTASVVNRDNDYMDMSPCSYENRTTHNNRMTSSGSSLSSQKLPSDDYLNMSPVNKSLLEVDCPTRSSIPDGYMEMSWKKADRSKKKTSGCNDNPSSSSDEYINMDYSNNNNDGAGKSDSSSSGAKDRSISLPITINKRLSKTENCPPAFLPLTQSNINPSVSPTRQTNVLGTRVRCDSRDSGIVTPSGSQATIFPFSPGSPIKQFVDQNDDGIARKCLVDGSSGIIKLSEEDIIEEEPRTPVPMPMGMNVDNLSNDYAIMNLGEPVSKKPNLAATPVQNKSASSSNVVTTTSSSSKHNSPENHHDYINCSPTNASRIITPTPITLENVDYAIMNPVVKTITKSTTESTSSSDVPPVTSSKKSLFLTLSIQEKLNNSNSCFKPIVEDRQQLQHPILQRHTSEKGNSRSSTDSGYEILVRPNLSRPNSVNSEKIKTSSSASAIINNRPSSANSERLALSSTSSSTSTLCEIQSHNNTVPSPMSIVTSRPESVSSDIHMASRPPSVTSERELHYASLDLPACSSNNLLHIANQQQQQQQSSKMEIDDGGITPRMDFSPQTTSSSSSASSQQSQQQPAFTYAQIDFVKSDCLKQQNNTNINQSGSKN